MKKVTVVTVDTRKFVEDILKLGSVGGKITDDCVAYKGMLLRAEVVVPVSAVVETNERVKVSAEYVADQVLAQEAIIASDIKEDNSVVENKTYTREELESMTIKQVRDITGSGGRDKAKMIDDYLKKE